MNPTINKAEISYKDISINDFEVGYNIESKKIIPDENGYVSEQVSNYFICDEARFHKSETVLLNFGVGQGKSTTLNNLVNQYISNDYLAIILVPFKSLIDKYYNEFENLGSNRFNYRLFEDDDLKDSILEYVDKDLHVLSINAFLRNPGNDYVEQSRLKQLFLNKLHNRCKDESKKVVLFIDEIHASIHNFQRDKIFHLLNWSDVVHKSFIASATFTETSIQVSKYISLLTKNNITILKGDRVKIEYKRANIKLLLSNLSYSSKSINNLEKLIPIIRDGLSQNKKVNILSYSKNLAKKVHDDYKSIFNDFNIELKLCTSETDYEFNEEHPAHVGTNFSTGVNIDGGIFIILLPPHSMIEGIGSYGVFSGGYVAMVQSIARMRSNGQIYICSSIPTKLLKGAYISNINPFLNQFKTVKNFDLRQQQNIIKSYYNELKEKHFNQIKFIESIKDSTNDLLKYGYLNHLGIQLNYPTYEEFLLKYGDKLLYTKYHSYGKKILPYLFWALFNDQFQNAKLTQVIVEEPKELNFNDDNIYDVLYEALSNEYNSETLFGNSLSGLVFTMSEKEILLDFQSVLSSYNLLLNGKKVYPNHNKVVKALLQIISCKLMGNDTYSDKNYFNDCIEFAQKSSLDLPLINLYREMGDLKSLFVDFIEQRKIEKDGGCYLPSTLNNEFALTTCISSASRSIVLGLNEHDSYLKSRVFSLLRGKQDLSDKLIYDKLVEIFLFVDTNLQKRVRNKRFNKYLGVFNSKHPMNLIFEEERDPLNFLDEEVVKDMFETALEEKNNDCEQEENHQIVNDNVEHDAFVEEVDSNVNINENPFGNPIMPSKNDFELDEEE